MPTGKNEPGTRPPGRKEKKMDTEISEMQPTCSLQKVLETDARDNPFATFLKYDLAEVRNVCVKKLNDIRHAYSYHADQAEALVKKLREGKDHNYWEKILEWYLFAAEDSDWRDKDATILKRAIEFALTLAHDEESLIAKLLVGRLKKGTFSIEMYGKMPALKNFFHELLRKVYWEKKLRKGRGVLLTGQLWSETWQNAVRAIEVAVPAGDFSLIEDIERIIFLMEEGALYPAQYEHWSLKDTRIAYLKAAKERLEEAKQEAAEWEAEEEMEEELE